jgi:hypothetical protein
MSFGGGNLARGRWRQQDARTPLSEGARRAEPRF